MLEDRDSGRLNGNDMPSRMPGGKASLGGASVLMSPMKGGLFVPLVFQPIFRSYRIQWALGLLWAVFCGKVMYDSTKRMDVSLQSLFLYESFLYYNPLFMTAFMLWLWGLNLFGLGLSRVSYAKVFDLDHSHLTHRDVWQIAGGFSLSILTSMAVYLYLFSHGYVGLAASQPVLLYCAIPLILALPFNILYASSRLYFLNTLFRLTFPFQPITFADFFVADVLTSMAKVLSDVERSICRMSHGQVGTIAWLEAGDMCGSHSVMIPCILAYPYVCRFFQCLRQYSDTKEKPCIFNAIKYSTAFPVIILSALKYHVELEAWRGFYRPLWIAAAILNTCYSFYWDIARDWDFGCFAGNCGARNPLLRNNLYYPRKWVYYWAIASNLVLRVSWTYKLSAHLRNNLATVLIVTSLEMVRRCQWVFFRVENEWNKMSMKAAAASGASAPHSGAGGAAGLGVGTQGGVMNGAEVVNLKDVAPVEDDEAIPLLTVNSIESKADV